MEYFLSEALLVVLHLSLFIIFTYPGSKGMKAQNTKDTFLR
jgi:hypothetical protein